MRLGRRFWGVVLGTVIGIGLIGYEVGAGSEAKDPAPVPGVKAEFIGGKKCKKCHIKQNKSWKKTKHAGAWDLLKEEHRNDDAKDEGGKACVSCHITGYGQPGGPATMQEGLDMGLQGTQCEACHGAGSEHAALAKEHKGKDPVPDVVKQAINKVPQNTCVGCHDPHVTHEQYKAE